MTKRIILGAGLSGLATAWFGKTDYLVIERESRVGGLTRTEDIDGFLFNHTGHWLHLRDERIKALVEDLLPGKMLTIERRAAIYSNGVFTLYPYQANLHGLPPDVLRECLQGAVSAAVHRAGGRMAEPQNFTDYAKLHFGEGIARHFIVPYNTKLWGVSPDEVTAEWTERFVPVPDITQIIDGALGFSAQAMGYNAAFLYPAKDGIEALPRAMFDRLDRNRFLFNTAPTRISLKDRVIDFAGTSASYDHLVSSLALPNLISLCADAPDHIRTAAGRLRCSPLKYINVALDVPTPLGGNHWIYLPEARFPFYRVGSASNAVPGLAPKGKSSLYVEVANDQNAPEADIVASLKSFLKEIGTIERDDQLLFAAFRTHPYGYVIFDDNCATDRETILDYLRSFDVDSIGRYGSWTYNSMEDALLDGLRVVADRG